MKANPLFLLSGLGMIAVGVGFVVSWALRKKLSIVPFLLGAAAWAVSVALKAGFALVCNRPVRGFLTLHLKDWLAGPLFWLYIGLLTGVFECGLVLLLTLWPKIRDYDFDRAVAFGTGFGAVEAILLGLGSLAAVIAAMAMPDKMPKVLMDSFSGGGLVVLAPIVERLFAVILHAFACALILVGARHQRLSFFWLSFVYKTLVDAVAAWGQLGLGVDTPGHIWMLEAVVAVFGVAGLIGLRWLAVRERPAGSEAAATITK